MTGLPPFHRAFDLPLQGVLHTDNPHYYRGHEEGETESQFVERIVNNLEELIISEGPETVSAFIAEPILGVAGVIVPPNGYYERVQSVLNKYDIHFIDDEVICGFDEKNGKRFKK